MIRRSPDGSSEEGQGKGKGISKEIGVVQITLHKYYRDRVKVSARSPPPSHTQPTIDITSRTPGREQPALPTGTQGERRSLLHGNGVPPPIVGRLGASECRVGSRESCDRPSTTMVRVPGSSGASGFHRESLGEDDVNIKVEHGMEVSAAEGSPPTRENYRSPDRQGTGRGLDDFVIKEEDRSNDLEEKPLLPPQVPLGTTADRTAKYDLLGNTFSGKTEIVLSTTTTPTRYESPSRSRSQREPT